MSWNNPGVGITSLRRVHHAVRQALRQGTQYAQNTWAWGTLNANTAWSWGPTSTSNAWRWG